MSLLSSAALTGTSGMPLALADATCGPSESACTGTTMMALTPWLISESTWLAWVDTSRLAEFQTSSMLLSLAYWSIPSLPAVMNELMSYTETPILVLPLLDSVSPAPQAVRPRPSMPAEAMATNFVVSLIWSLTLVDRWIEKGFRKMDHVRRLVDQTSTATAATIRTPLITSCQ